MAVAAAGGYVCAGLGDAVAAFLHHGRHRSGAAEQCGLDDLPAWHDRQLGRVPWLADARQTAARGAGAVVGKERRAAAAAAAMLLCIACIGGHTVKEGLDNRFATSLEAVWELANGTPQAFAAAMDEREAILSDPEIDDAVIRPLTGGERPGLLYFSDVTPGPDTWGLTEYYGKNSVYVEAPEE